MGRVSEAQINEAIANFDYEGKLLSKEPLNSKSASDMEAVILMIHIF